jgi:hypothetical protein
MSVLSSIMYPNEDSVKASLSSVNGMLVHILGILRESAYVLAWPGPGPTKMAAVDTNNGIFYSVPGEEVS